MSENIILTPEQIAAKALADEQAARVAQYQSLVGKTFKPKNQNPRTPNQHFVVTRYAGALTHASVGRKAHTLEVESRNPADLKFTPIAVQFLENYEPFTPANAENDKEIV